MEKFASKFVRNKVDTTLPRQTVGKLAGKQMVISSAMKKHGVWGFSSAKVDDKFIINIYAILYTAHTEYSINHSGVRICGGKNARKCSSPE